MAEGAPLLRVYTLTRIEGSNPSLSAIYCIATAGIRIGSVVCRKADSNPRFKQAGFDREARQRVAEASASVLTWFLSIDKQRINKHHSLPLLRQ